MTRALILAALLASPAALAAPGFIPIQGVLTDSGGTVVDGQVDVTFTLYSDSTGSTSIWSDTLTLDVIGGSFAAELGSGAVPLDLDSFANYPAVHMQVQVSGDSAMPLVPLDHVPYAAWAEKTGEASTLEGVSLASLRAEIPAATDMEDAARNVAFDSESELTAVLNDNYLSAAYTPAWSTLAGVPAGFADNTDDGFTTEAELLALLDDDYLHSGEDLSVGGELDMGGNTIGNLADPSAEQDASTKAYVDAAVADAVDQRFYYAKVNLDAGTYVDRDGNTETIVPPTISGGTACSSGNSVCVHHNGTNLEVSFLVPAATTVDPASTGDNRDNGTNNCWPTAPGDNEWSVHGFGNGIDNYASDLNGGHDSCITSNTTTQTAGGTHCLGLRTTGTYLASHTSYGVVCIR